MSALRGVITCTECGRSKPRAEVWQLIFVDLAEVAIYCPECTEREFGTGEG